MRVAYVLMPSLAVVAGCSRAQAPKHSAADDAPVTQVGMVTPTVIGITFRCGRSVYGTQMQYTRQEGDQVDPGKDRWVRRGGKFIGALVGAEGKILWTPDQVEGPAFAPEWARGDGYRVAIGAVAPAPPVAVCRKSKAADLARTGPWEFQSPTEDIIYLKLPGTPATGARVSVRFTGDRSWQRSFTFDPTKLRSEAVHVSHLGFRPDESVKIAFLSCWLGDGGGAAYDPPPAFRVVDDTTGTPAMSGRARLSKAASDKTEDAYNHNHNLADVYEMDFSEVATPGRYRVVVEGIGCSVPFDIADDVWRKAFTVSARGFFHQRSGIALGPPYTTFKRPRPFYPADGVKVSASTTGLMDTGDGLATEGSNFGNLVKGATAIPVANAWGGYMDAGDWDRRIQHLDVSRLLLELAE